MLILFDVAKKEINIGMKEQKKFDRAYAICQEFCNHVYMDAENFSFLTNCTYDWFEELAQRLKKIGFVLTHKTEMEKTVTSAFILFSKVHR